MSEYRRYPPPLLSAGRERRSAGWRRLWLIVGLIVVALMVLFVADDVAARRWHDVPVDLGVMFVGAYLVYWSRRRR